MERAQFQFDSRPPLEATVTDVPPFSRLTEIIFFALPALNSRGADLLFSEATMRSGKLRGLMRHDPGRRISAVGFADCSGGRGTFSVMEQITVVVLGGATEPALNRLSE